MDTPLGDFEADEEEEKQIAPERPAKNSPVKLQLEENYLDSLA
jgi:hypothetical protein